MEQQNYEIDFSKVKTFADVLKILYSLHIECTEQYAFFDELKPYLKKVDN